MTSVGGVGSKEIFNDLLVETATAKLLVHYLNRSKTGIEAKDLQRSKQAFDALGVKVPKNDKEALALLNKLILKINTAIHPQGKETVIFNEMNAENQPNFRGLADSITRLNDEIEALNATKSSKSKLKVIDTDYFFKKSITSEIKQEGIEQTKSTSSINELVDRVSKDLKAKVTNSWELVELALPSKENKFIIFRKNQKNEIEQIDVDISEKGYKVKKEPFTSFHEIMRVLDLEKDHYVKPGEEKGKRKEIEPEPIARKVSVAKVEEPIPQRVKERKETVQSKEAFQELLALSEQERKAITTIDIQFKPDNPEAFMKNICENFPNLAELKAQDIGLKELPQEIGNLKKLTALDLSNNLIDKLPAEFKELKNLQSLNLSNNYFRQYPEEISSLTNLQSLNLSQNSLGNTCDVTNLLRLRHLFLAECSMRELPSGIADLKEMKSLDVSGNKLDDLESLVKEFAHLRDISELHLKDNDFDDLKFNFGEFLVRYCDHFNGEKNLRVLKDKLIEAVLVCDPKTHAILKGKISTADFLGPKEFFDILQDTLKEVAKLPPKAKIVTPEAPKQAPVEKVSEKKYREPSEEVLIVTSISDLRKADIDKDKVQSIKIECDPNKLDQILDEISREFPRLENLDLSSLALREIPEGLSRIANLKKLDLSGNSLLYKLPESLGNLKELRILDLSGTGIDDLPKVLSRLENLEYVNLTNVVFDLPTEFKSIISEFNRVSKNAQRDTSIDLKASLLDFASKKIKEGDARDILLENIKKEGPITPASFVRVINDSIDQVKAKEEGERPVEEESITLDTFSIDDLHNSYIDKSKVVSITVPPDTENPDALVVEICKNYPNLQVLNLFNVGLTKLPKEISELTQLQSLFLENNKLTELPPEIGTLQNLEDLRLSNNLLTTLPDELSDLSNLKYLFLDFNELEEIPESFSNLRELTYLNIACNTLTTIPMVLSIMPNLSQLAAFGNVFDLKFVNLLGFFNEERSKAPSDEELKNTLNDHIAQLFPVEAGENAEVTQRLLSEKIFHEESLTFPTLLKILSETIEELQAPIEAEEIEVEERIPTQITSLKDISDLSAEEKRKVREIIIPRGTKNPEKILEEICNNFPNLEVLTLKKLGITKLPENIGNLQHLERLDLTGNALTALPENFSKLTNLGVLSLNDNNLTDIHPIERLTNLEVLLLAKNQLASLPRSIGNLSNLRELICKKNKLTQVPEELSKCSEMQILDFGQNNLLAWPKAVNTLSKLTTLYFDQNENLTLLPDDFGALKDSLEYLNVGNCGLVQFPPSLYEFPKLHSLILYNNNFEEGKGPDNEKLKLKLKMYFPSLSKAASAILAEQIKTSSLRIKGKVEIPESEEAVPSALEAPSAPKAPPAPPQKEIPKERKEEMRVRRGKARKGIPEEWKKEPTKEEKKPITLEEQLKAAQLKKVGEIKKEVEEEGGIAAGLKKAIKAGEKEAEEEVEGVEAKEWEEDDENEPI